MPTIIKQHWREYERGWGHRPDGYSLHLTLADRQAFVTGYDITWNTAETAPDEYSVAIGDPQPIEVSAEVVAALQTHKDTGDSKYPYRVHGIWLDDRSTPDSILGSQP